MRLCEKGINCFLEERLLINEQQLHKPEMVFPYSFFLGHFPSTLHRHYHRVDTKFIRLPPSKKQCNKKPRMMEHECVFEERVANARPIPFYCMLDWLRWEGVKGQIKLHYSSLKSLRFEHFRTQKPDKWRRAKTSRIFQIHSP